MPAPIALGTFGGIHCDLPRFAPMLDGKTDRKKTVERRAKQRGRGRAACRPALHAGPLASPSPPVQVHLGCALHQRGAGTPSRFFPQPVCTGAADKPPPGCACPRAGVPGLPGRCHIHGRGQERADRAEDLPDARVHGHKGRLPEPAGGAPPVTAAAISGSGSVQRSRPVQRGPASARNPALCSTADAMAWPAAARGRSPAS